MRTLFAVAVLLAVGAGRAHGVGCPGLLTPTAQTTTGPSGDTAIPGQGTKALAFQVVSTTGTATVQIEMCCVTPCGAGTWAVVANSPMSVSPGTPSTVVSVLSPTCIYRANATACSGCSFTVGIACSY